jgi:hypothetical protein
MSYPSVDQLQKVLTEQIFLYTDDKKKAAGRALGTLVEIITFYLLKTWGLESAIAIERGLAEYANPAIRHNVEYSLHPVTSIADLTISGGELPVTTSKLFAKLRHEKSSLVAYESKPQTVLSKDGVLRNACVIGYTDKSALVALVHKVGKDTWEFRLVEQLRQPYAMFECKRVGVEEGQRKGPQTIEKAKQGAYVARTVSSLQKVRIASGELHGVISRQDGTLYSKPYGELLSEIIASSSPDLLRNFILTVGVVSNHGNWFTGDNQNKELMVLAQSYDWLLFLTDAGLASFIQDVLLKPKTGLQPARDAFLASYTATKKKNQFTKVQMSALADAILQNYFRVNQKSIEGWFNIITPKTGGLPLLRKQLAVLSKKNWSGIIGL